MSEQYLEFERPVQELALRMQELSDAMAAGQSTVEKNPAAEISRLNTRRVAVLRQVYRGLDAWQKVQVARHPARPQPAFYIEHLIENFQPLAGDKLYGEDAAIIAGIGTFEGKPVAVMGTNKGKNTKERVAVNFGMPKPEGYRKAKRIMELADKFNLPLLTFVDTPGAYPGVEAEARGQGEAIASCIETLLNINVPVVSVITGEGGSGGALALATADVVMLLEHSVYSVISPEGCASILWREATKKTVPEAANALNITAQQLHKFGLVDAVIKEPVGAAHRDTDLILKRVREAIVQKMPKQGSKQVRRAKFLALTK